MAIAYDKEGHNNTGAGSVSFNLAATAADEVAFIFASYSTALGASAISCTVNGNAATQIGSEFTILTGRKARMWYYVNPPTSSVSYAFSVTGTGDGIQAGALLYSGVDTTAPVDSSNTGTGSGTSFSASTTVVASDCWLACFAQTYAGNLTASTGTTERFNIAGAGHEKGGDSNGTVGTGSQSMSWTCNSGSYGWEIVSINPAATGYADLVAAAGSFTFSGVNANLPRGYYLASSQGTYTLTGVTAVLTAARSLTAALGTYTLSGIAANIVKGFTMTAALGAYTLTGVAASLTAARSLTAALGTYTLTGVAAALNKGYTLAAALGTYTLTGFDAAFSRAYALTAALGTYTLTGVSAALSRLITMAAAVGSYTFTGVDAGIYFNRLLSAAVGTFTLAGVSAAINRLYTLTAALGTYTLTGVAVTLTKAITLIAEAGSYSLSFVRFYIPYQRFLTNINKNSGSLTNIDSNQSTLTNINK